MNTQSTIIINEKTLLKIKLIVEEMEKNIFEHAYNENENKYLNIRIKYKIQTK